MTQQLTLGSKLGGTEAWHVLSDERPVPLYRYELGFRWAPGPLAVGALCNPSTAVAGQHDHTTRKWTGFAKRWGCGGWLIVNVAPFRTTDPNALLDVDDPINARVNIEHLRAAFRLAAEPGARLVFGWGDALPRSLRCCTADLVAIARVAGAEPLCLGYTASGQPRHPLMLAYDTPLQPFEARP